MLYSTTYRGEVLVRTPSLTKKSFSPLMILEQVQDIWPYHQIPPTCFCATDFFQLKCKHTNKSKGPICMAISLSLIHIRRCRRRG